MIIEHLRKKYGAEITGKLVLNGELHAQNIIFKNESDQILVQDHISSLNDELKLGMQIENTKWAFDFPGWLGALGMNGSTDKKYFIIGLEPHVERYDYQVTYGLSKTTPKGEERFSIGEPERFTINCKEDSSLIWSNLFHILATEEEINDVSKNKDKEILMRFLSQFYITDLCHFAPQDKAKAIFGIKNWKSIRFNVAKHFLKSEIEIVNPKVVIAQGNGVFSELSRILDLKEIESYPIEGTNWSLKKGIFKNGYKVLSLPHFGSKMNYNTFWRKHRDKVRRILIKKELV
jgi:hypothetical protein